MKNLYLLVLVLFCATRVFAQEELQKAKIENIKNRVVQFFNAQSADSLYSLAGAAFKKSISAEKFEGIGENNLFPLGQIKLAEFEKIDKGISKYKITTDVAILSMYIGLDSAGLLETFLFQPYKKEVTGEFKKTRTDNLLATDQDKKVDAIVQPFMFESKTVALSIGVLQGGKTYFYNYGEIKKGNGQLPSSKSLYEIGSITKTFTGILLAKAITENKIGLNDPVNKYLPKNIPLISFGDDTLKIVHLANHTSGLPPLPDNFDTTSLSNPYKDYDEKKLLEYMKHASLHRKPGEKFEYCNLAVGLLGYILQQVNKMPFEKMVTNFITSKAGMINTKQFLTSNDSALFVQGYDETISPQSQWDFKALTAAGSLRSNAEDMLKYAALNLKAADGKLQQAIELSHMQTFDAGQQQIALNWFIQNWGWGKLLFHGGATGGYRSLLAVNPKTGNAIIILSNTAVSSDEVGVSILKYIDK